MGVFGKLFTANSGQSSTEVERGDSVIGLRGDTEGARGKLREIKSSDSGDVYKIFWLSGPHKDTETYVMYNEVRGTGMF